MSNTRKRQTLEYQRGYADAKKIYERKKGEWVRHFCEDGNTDGWECSQCAERYYFGEKKPNF